MRSAASPQAGCAGACIVRRARPGLLEWWDARTNKKMFAWLTNRRRRRQQPELLAQAITQLKESQQTGEQLAELCEKLSRTCGDQAKQMTDLCAENGRLWTALSAPKELQPYMAAGCSQAEAEKLAKEAPCGA